MERTIKFGLVQKRSVYLKQWRKRYLVLRETTLSTYKTKDFSEKPTMNLLLSDITEAVPTVMEIEKDFCFRISCEDEFYITVESDSELCLWLNLINHVRAGKHISLFNSPHFSNESKALSEETLIKSFTQIKEIICERENETVNLLRETYEKYREKAEFEHRVMGESLEAEMENCRFVAESLSSERSLIEKIQQIQRLSKEKITFKAFDCANESQLKLSMDQSIVSKVLRPNIKVSLKNDSELSLRRTTLTRALKWRYTGNKIDAVTFTVTQDIELLGVGICTPYKSPGSITVKEFQVLKGHSTNATVIYKHTENPIIRFNPDDSVYRLSISEVLLIKKDVKYTVMVIIEGSHTYKCVDCFAVVEGETTWKFFNTQFAAGHQSNRNDITCGPIADFYYSQN